MSKQYHLKINGELIPVSEEVYRAYQRPKWREKKRRKILKDKEYSYDFLLEHGFIAPTDPEQSDLADVVSDKLLLNGLLKAIASLNEDERVLIYALFYKGMTVSDVSDNTGVPRTTLSYRKKKVLDKLRKLLNGI